MDDEAFPFLHELTLDAPELGGPRRARVFLPVGADPDLPRPTLYLFDGQNVFTDDGSFSGGWFAARAVVKLLGLRRAIAPIVVGIDHGGERRLDELGPFRSGEHGGGTDALIEFMATKLIPAVTERCPTIAGPTGAVIGGSSMGGLAAMYAHFRAPELFGGALCMSPSFWFANAAIVDYVREAAKPSTSRVYIDCGVREGRGVMYPPALRMVETLRARGYDDQDLLWRPDARGTHSETSWRRRLPKALRFMFGT